jgi:hypothetical protein
MPGITARALREIFWPGFLPVGISAKSPQVKNARVDFETVLKNMQGVTE